MMTSAVRNSLSSGRTSIKNIPDAWQIRVLKELGHVYGGLSGKSKDDFGSGKKYIPYKNIFMNSSIDPAMMDYVAISEKETQNAVMRGDIFFTASSETPDEVGISSVLLEDIGLTYLNSFCFGFRLNNFDILTPEFAKFVFRAELFRKQMSYLAQGSTRFNLPRTELLKASVPLPPLTEQHKISAILSTWDRAIELVGKQIAAKQRLKRVLTQRLLAGTVRFLGFGKLAKGGKRPEGWQDTRLKNIAKITVSNVDKKISETEVPVLLCNYLDVYNNEYVSGDLQFMEATASRSEITKFQLKVGDIVFTKDSETRFDIASAALVVEDIDKLVCGYHLAILRPDKHLVDSLFLAKTISQGPVNTYFISHANGATRYGLTLPTIENAPIRLPSLPEQQRIGATFKEMDRELEALQKKSEYMGEQKRGLMQKLLVGKIRVRT